jgi:4-hydroxybenzoate polyprenyltransferase
MEIAAVSASAAELAAAYLRTRLPASRFGPLVLGLVLASLAGGPPPGPGALGRRLLLALSLVVHFRVWDDLADRGPDAVRHPDRILVASGRLGPFHALWAAAAAASAALLATGPWPARRLLAWALLALALGAWYAAFRRRVGHPLLRAHVVLVKYPVFVYLLGGETARPLPRLLAALAVYLALCAYEVLHDPEVARAPGARQALRAEVAGLVTASVALAVSLVWAGPA